MVDSRENKRTPQPQITQTNYIESIEELNKMDIFVCGTCYFVAHFVEEFISHKEMPCVRRDVIQPNTSDQKPQVWSFLLWKNAKHRANTQNSSWQLYQEWCSLPESTKDAWIEAGQFLKISSTMKNAGGNLRRFNADGISLDEEELSSTKATIPNNPTANSNKVMKKTRSGKYVEVIVERILAKRITNKRTEYWVKYRGRSTSDELKHWEPIESMSATCQDMISSFESKTYLGQDASGRKRTLSQTGSELNSAGLLNNVVGNKQKMEHVKQWIQDDTSGRIHGDDDDVAKKKLRTDGLDIDNTEDYEDFFLRQKGGIILRATMKSCPKSTHSEGVTKKKNLAAEIGLESEEEEEEGGKENIFGRKNVPAVLKPHEQKNVSPPPSSPIPSSSRSSQRVKSKKAQINSSCLHNPTLLIDLKQPRVNHSLNTPGKRIASKTVRKKPTKKVVSQLKSSLLDLQSNEVNSDLVPTPKNTISVYDQVECSLANMLQEPPFKTVRRRNQKAKTLVDEKEINKKDKGKAVKDEPLNNEKATNKDNSGDKTNNREGKLLNENVKNRKCKTKNENTRNKKRKTKTMAPENISNGKGPIEAAIEVKTNRKEQIKISHEKSTNDEIIFKQAKSYEEDNNEQNKAKPIVQKAKKKSVKAKTTNNEITNNRKKKSKAVNFKKFNNKIDKATDREKEIDSEKFDQKTLEIDVTKNQNNTDVAIKNDSTHMQKNKVKEIDISNHIAINIVDETIPYDDNYLVKTDEISNITIPHDDNYLVKTDEISNIAPKPQTCSNKKIKPSFKEFLEQSKQNSWLKSMEVLRKIIPSKLTSTKENLNSTWPNLETKFSDRNYSNRGFKKVLLALEGFNNMNNNATEGEVSSLEFQKAQVQINKAACFDCATIQSDSTNESPNEHIPEIEKSLVKTAPKTRLKKKVNRNTKIKVCQVQEIVQDVQMLEFENNISLRKSVDSVQYLCKLENHEPKSRSKSIEPSGSYPADNSSIQNNTVSSSVYPGECSSSILLTSSISSAEIETRVIIEVDKKVNETSSKELVIQSNGPKCVEYGKMEDQIPASIDLKEDTVDKTTDGDQIEPVSSTIVIAKPKRIRAKGTKNKNKNNKKIPKVAVGKKITASRSKKSKMDVNCEKSRETEKSMWVAGGDMLGEDFLAELIDSTLADINDKTLSPNKTQAHPNENSSTLQTEIINANVLSTNCDLLNISHMLNPRINIEQMQCFSTMEETPQIANLLEDKNEQIFNTSVPDIINEQNSASNNKNGLSMAIYSNYDILVPPHNVTATDTFSLNKTESVLSSKEDSNKSAENNPQLSKGSVQDQKVLNSEYVNAFCLDFLLDSSHENVMDSASAQSDTVGSMDTIQQNTETPCSSSSYVSFTPSPNPHSTYHELRVAEPRIPNYDPRNSGLKLPTVRQKFPVINPPGKIKLVRKKNMSQETSPIPSPIPPSPLHLPPPHPLPSAPCLPRSYLNYQPYRRNFEANIVDPWGSDYPGEAPTLGALTKRKPARKRKINADKKIVLPSRKSYLSRFLADPNAAVIPSTWSPPNEQDTEEYETNGQITSVAHDNGLSSVSCDSYDTTICFEVNSSFELVRKYSTNTDANPAELTPLASATCHGKDLLSQYKDAPVSSLSQPLSYLWNSSHIQNETDISALLNDPSVLIQWDSASTQAGLEEVSSTIPATNETCAFSFLTSDYDEVSVSYPKLCLQTDASHDAVTESPWQLSDSTEQIGFHLKGTSAITAQTEQIMLPCLLDYDQYFVQDMSEPEPQTNKDQKLEDHSAYNLISLQQTDLKPDMPSLNADSDDLVN